MLVLGVSGWEETPVQCVRASLLCVARPPCPRCPVALLCVSFNFGGSNYWRLLELAPFFEFSFSHVLPSMHAAPSRPTPRPPSLAAFGTSPQPPAATAPATDQVFTAPALTSNATVSSTARQRRHRARCTPRLASKMATSIICTIIRPHRLSVNPAATVSRPRKPLVQHPTVLETAP